MKAALYKSRHTVEKMQAEAKLDYATGMDRYYGLFEFAKKFGLVEKCGNGFKFTVGSDPKQLYMPTSILNRKRTTTKKSLMLSKRRSRRGSLTERLVSRCR